MAASSDAGSTALKMAGSAGRHHRSMNMSAAALTPLAAAAGVRAGKRSGKDVIDKGKATTATVNAPMTSWRKEHARSLR